MKVPGQLAGVVVAEKSRLSKIRKLHIQIRSYCKINRVNITTEYVEAHEHSHDLQ